jgi:hypothetical protein
MLAYIESKYAVSLVNFSQLCSFVFSSSLKPFYLYPVILPQTGNYKHHFPFEPNGNIWSILKFSYSKMDPVLIGANFYKSYFV